MQTVQHHLETGQARTLDARAASELHVLRGVLWLTQSHDANDYFLAAGQTMALRGKHRGGTSRRGKCSELYRSGEPRHSTDDRGHA